MCSALYSISLPNSVTNIKLAAFINCSSLSSIIIPNETTINDGIEIFANCDNLESIIIRRRHDVDVNNTLINRLNSMKTNEQIPLEVTITPVIIPDKPSIVSIVKIFPDSIRVNFDIGAIYNTDDSVTRVEYLIDYADSLTNIAEWIPLVKNTHYDDTSGNFVIPLVTTSTYKLSLKQYSEIGRYSDAYTINNISIAPPSPPTIRSTKYGFHSIYVKFTMPTASNALTGIYYTIKNPHTSEFDWYLVNPLNYDDTSGNFIISLSETDTLSSYTVYMRSSSELGGYSTETSANAIRDYDNTCYLRFNSDIDTNNTIGGYSFSKYDTNTYSIQFESDVSIPLDFMLNEYQDNLLEVELPTDVTSIGNNAFKDCINLQSIYIPTTVTSIGDNAFEKCNITTCILPDNLISIGNGTFKDCNNLSSIEIPNNVSSVGTSIFEGCSNLSSIALSVKLPSIPNSTFSGCSNLQFVELPPSVTFIGANAFSNCSNLYAITIPNNVNSIGNEAFNGCSSLHSITLSTSVIYWGVNVTTNSGVTTIVINYIDTENSYTETYIHNRLTLLNIDNIYTINTSRIISDPAYNILTSDSIVSVTPLGNYVADLSFQSISRYVYNYNATSSQYGSILSYINGNDKKQYIISVNIPNTVTSIENVAFAHYTNLYSVRIPNSVISIDTQAFIYTNLHSVIIPNSVISIGQQAFYETKIKHITLGVNILSWYRNVVTNTSNGLIDISLNYIEGEGDITNTYIYKELDGVTDLYNSIALVEIIDLHGYRTDLSSGIVSITPLVGYTVTSDFSAISRYVYDYNDMSGETPIISHINNVNKNYIISVNIPDTVTSISDGAFNRYNNLYSVTMADTVTSIGNHTFEWCTRLQTVKISNNVISIGSYVFYQTNLQSVIIPDSVISIDDGAFHYTNLQSVIIPNSVISVGNDAFSETKIKHITLGVNILLWNIDGVTSSNSLIDISLNYIEGEGDITNTYIYKALHPDTDANKYKSIDLVKITDLHGYRTDLSSGIVSITPLVGYTVTSDFSAISRYVYDYNDMSGETPILSYINGNDKKQYIISVNIPNTVTSIENGAFAHYTNLYSVTMADTVTSIGTEAFSACTRLQTVKISNNVISIESYAFSNTNLHSVIIPNSVIYVHYMSFFATKIKHITLSVNILKWHENGLSDSNGPIDISLNYIKGEGDITNTYIYKALHPDTDANKYKSIDLVKITDLHGYRTDLSSGIVSITPLVGYTVTSDFSAISRYVYDYNDMSGDLPILSHINDVNKKQCIISVNIPNTVTRISDGKFSGYDNLYSVTMADTVTSIGFEAFAGCTRLQTVKISNNVISIESYAFSNTNLQTVIIPNSVIYVGNRAFYETKITHITLGVNILLWNIDDGVTSSNSLIDISLNYIKGEGDIETTYIYKTLDGATDTNKYKSITLVEITDLHGYRTDLSSGIVSITPLVGYTVTSDFSAISRYVYDYNDMSGDLPILSHINDVNKKQCIISVNIPDTVTSISDGAFAEYYNVYSVTMADTVTSIGGAAFNGCTRLQTVKISNSVISIGELAFSNTNLQSVIIPNSVIYVGNGAFSGTKIKHITLGVNILLWNIDGVTSSNSLIDISLNYIEGEGDITNTYIYKALHPDTDANKYKSIDLVKITDLHGYRTDLSSGIVSITPLVGYTVTSDFSAISRYVYNYNDMSGDLPILSHINNNNKQQYIISVNIPDTVTSISYGEFSGYNNLYSVTMADTVTSIGGAAFNGCTRLPSVIIPNNVNSIGDNAFSGCSSLQSITLSTSVIYWGDDVTTSSFVIDIVINYIDTENSYTETYIYNRLTSLNIDNIYTINTNSIISVPAYNIRTPDSIVSVTPLGDYVADLSFQSISRYVYNYNATYDGLSILSYINENYKNYIISVNIPDTVPSIENDKYKNYKNLYSVVIPNSVMYIGSNAFENTNLYSVEIPNSVSSIGNKAFFKDSTAAIPNTSINHITLSTTIISWGESVTNTDTPIDISLNYIAKEGDASTSYIYRKLKSISSSIYNKIYSIEIPDVPLTYNPSTYSIVSVTPLTNLNIDSSFQYISRYMYDYSTITSVNSNHITNGILNKEYIICVNIPNTVTSIENDKYKNYKNLYSVVIPNSVMYIGSNAFENTNLYSVEIPNSVSSIGNKAFFKDSTAAIPNTSINHITLSTTIISWGESVTNTATPIDISLNYIATEGDATRSYIYKQLKSISSSIYDKIDLKPISDVPSDYKLNITNGIVSVTPLTELNLLYSYSIDSYKSISRYIYNYDSSRLTAAKTNGNQKYIISVNIPSTVNTIPSNQFQSYTSLLYVDIPNTVESIESESFKGCNILYSVVIPNSVTIIGDSAFADCTSLHDITISTRTNSIGDSAFNNTDLSNVYIRQFDTDDTNNIKNIFTETYSVDNDNIETYSISKPIEITGMTPTPYIIDVSYNLGDTDDTDQVTKVEYSVNNTYDWKPVEEPFDGSFTINDREPYTTYTVYMRQYTEFGGYSYPDSSGTITTFSINTPSAPTIKSVASDLISIVLTYKLGDTKNSGMITTLEYASIAESLPVPDVNSELWKAITPIPDYNEDDNTFTIKPLDPYITYKVYMRETTLHGEYPSDPSEPSDPVRPYNDTSPEGPIITNVIKYPTKFEVRFDLGDTNNSGNVTSVQYRYYQIDYDATTPAPTLKQDWTDVSYATPDDRDFSIKDLSKFTEYRIEMRQKTVYGNFSSATFQELTTNDTIPFTLIFSESYGNTIINIQGYDFTFISGDSEPVNGIYVYRTNNEIISIPAYFIPDEKRHTLVNISIPNTVKDITNNAFLGCGNLTNLTIPESIETIGDRAFLGCNSITQMIIPYGVSYIGHSAFLGCTGLTTVSIPASIESIKYRTFLGCSNLTTVNIGDDGDGNGVTNQNNVTYIGDGAFLGCSELSSISISPNCTYIGNRAFLGCVNVTGIIIPNSIVYIGYNAFSGCIKLGTLPTPDQYSTYTPGTYVSDKILSIESTSLSSEHSEISRYVYHYSSLESVTDKSGILHISMPLGTTTIDASQFSGYPNLLSITLPSTIISIGETAFADCPKLRSLVIYNTSGVDIDSNAFTNSSIEIITIHKYPNDDNTLLDSVKTKVNGLPQKTSVFAYNIPSV